MSLYTVGNDQNYFKSWINKKHAIPYAQNKGDEAVLRFSCRINF